MNNDRKQLGDGVRSEAFDMDDIAASFHCDSRIYVYFDVDDGFILKDECTTYEFKLG